MKKLFVPAVLCAALLLCSCSMNMPETEASQAPQSSGRDLVNDYYARHDNTGVYDDETVSARDFDTGEYKYESSGGTDYLVVITSNGTETVSVTGFATAYDAAGAKLGTASTDIDVLAPGETTVADFWFGGIKNIASVDWSFGYSTSVYDPIISTMDLSRTESAGGVTAVVISRCENAIKFPKVNALFFNSDGELVYYGSGYAVDTTGALQPNTSAAVTVSCPVSYDHAECYISARGS